MNAKQEVISPVQQKSGRFRVELVPATMLFMASVVSALIGAMIVPNIRRDALNGYDVRYLATASMLPGSLFGFAIFCSVAAYLLAKGNLQAAVAALFPAAAFASIVALRIFVLS